MSRQRMPIASKVLLSHSGRCLSPRLFGGFSGTAADVPKDLQLSEEVYLDFISDDEANALLQVSTRCSTLTSGSFRQLILI